MHLAKPVLTILLVLACSVRVAKATDESQPYGRLCLSLIDASGTETVYEPGANPTPGATIAIHADANAECGVLIAAFNEKGGALTNGWRPQWTQLGQWEEQQLPKAPAVWPWAKPAEPFSFWVLFIDPKSNDAIQIKKLVFAIQNPSFGKLDLESQTSKLHTLIEHAIAGQNRHLAPLAPAEAGGIMRGGNFVWRDFAHTVNFTPDAPGVLIFAGTVAK